MPSVFDTYYEQYQDTVRKSYINFNYDNAEARRQLVIKAREYDEGVQDTSITDRMREFLHISADQEFNVNYCSMVINAKSDRLKVTGFDIQDQAQSEWAWNLWRKTRMDRKQGIVHRASIRDGDAYILVEWDKVANMPRFYFEPAYDGDGVTVIYSDERRDEMKMAIKQWRINSGEDTGKMRRMNVYFPNRVEKYISTDDIANGAWAAYFDEDTIEMDGKFGKAGVVWWTDNGTETGEPLGIPIIHFKHNDTGYTHGTSHLANVMPLQDALNKSMIDLLAVMDAAGTGILVGYGTTAWDSVSVGPGAIASVNASPSEAALQRVEGENPQSLLAVYNALVMEIARISGTPLSYFQSSGQVAAEGTMKQQEIALVSQVEKSQTDFGNGWEDCMIMARRLENVFGKGGLNEDEIIDTIWDEAESRNDKEQAETLSIKVEKLGVSEEQAQTEMGYDDTQIAAFNRAKLRKQAMALRQAIPTTATSNDQNLTQTEGETANNGTSAETEAA